MLKPVPTIDNTSTDDRRWITCPMCGFEFDRGDTRCEHGCPLGAFCNLVACPNCDYEFPDRPRRTSWLARLLKLKDPDPLLPPGVKTAADLHPGDTADVVCLGSSKSPRYSSLAIYGLESGAKISVIQQHPSCVIHVDETELAIDRQIAQEILVRI